MIKGVTCTRDQMINTIIHLVDVMDIKKIEGWEDINFTKIETIRNQTDLLTEELVVLVGLLEGMFEKKQSQTQIEVSYLNNLEDEKVKKLIDFQKEAIEEWRYHIPDHVKSFVSKWPILPLEQLKIEVRELLDKEKEINLKEELEDFLGILQDLQWIEAGKSIDKEAIYPLQEKWRYQIPEHVKMFVSEWSILPPAQLEIEVRNLLNKAKGITLQVELEDFLEFLEDLQWVDEESFDPFVILSKYKNGRIKNKEAASILQAEEYWRKMIPSILKNRIKDWNTAEIQIVYDQAKSFIEIDRNTILPFVVELSQIIFDEREDDEDSELVEVESIDGIADSIRSLVEMIILPHLEVLDIIQQRGGNITFANIWNKPFTEKLKEEVKNRDGWKCVICESETNLHVHHKIPRNKGGIHHPDNLVTLCASCHGVIETADINKAFKKCLANYKKSKYGKIKPQVLSMDKKLLQEEVEKSLDDILFQLNQKDEHVLMEDVLGVMQRLEILFYG